MPPQLAGRQSSGKAPPTPNSRPKAPYSAILAGTIIGFVVVVAILVGIIVPIARRRRRRKNGDSLKAAANEKFSRKLPEFGHWPSPSDTVTPSESRPESTLSSIPSVTFGRRIGTKPLHGALPSPGTHTAHTSGAILASVSERLTADSSNHQPLENRASSPPLNSHNPMRNAEAALYAPPKRKETKQTNMKYFSGLLNSRFKKRRSSTLPSQENPFPSSIPARKKSYRMRSMLPLIPLEPLMEIPDSNGVGKDDSASPHSQNTPVANTAFTRGDVQTWWSKVSSQNPVASPQSQLQDQVNANECKQQLPRSAGPSKVLGSSSPMSLIPNDLSLVPPHSPLTTAFRTSVRSNSTISLSNSQGGGAPYPHQLLRHYPSVTASSATYMTAKSNVAEDGRAHPQKEDWDAFRSGLIAAKARARGASWRGKDGFGMGEDESQQLTQIDSPPPLLPSVNQQESSSSSGVTQDRPRRAHLRTQEAVKVRGEERFEQQKTALGSQAALVENVA